MSEGTQRIVLSVIAFTVVPCIYLLLCLWMYFKRVHWFCYLAYFFLFGVAGGSLVALALSPSGLAALCMLISLGAGPLACLGAAGALQSLSNRDAFANVALALCYTVAAVLLVPMVVFFIWNFF